MIARLLAILILAIATPATAETLAIVDARIVTLGPAGDIAKGTIVVRDGRIAAVGPGVRPPTGAKILDGEGLTVTPGLVATVTPLGLNDLIGSGWPGLTSSADRLSAGFSVAADYNTDNVQIPEARVEGVTRAIVTPNPPPASKTGGRKAFAGQAALVTLGEGLAPVLNPAVAMVASGGDAGAAAAGGGRGAWRTLVSEQLALARLYARAPASATPERLEALSLSQADLKALVPVVAGRAPLLVEANRAADIAMVLEMARSEKIRVILSGASDAWRMAQEIAAAGVPVILDAEENQAFTFETINATYENAAILHAAGVKIAFKPGIARIVFLIRTPRFLAGRTVRYGLPWEAALAAITRNPAEMFGYADEAGTLEVGKAADLVVWSGDPLETRTVARHVVIAGELQPMTSRSRLLRDRYIDDVRPPTAR